VKLIVGLGNPGKQYEETRHNVGFKVLDLLADRVAVRVDKVKDQALVGEMGCAGEKLLLIKPQTYMNLSGQAVGSIARWHKVKAEDILIIYDDLDLPVGKVRIRARGSAGGHNGIKSLIAHLGTDEFPRIRVGINKPPVGIPVPDYVLSNFLPNERESIGEAIVRSAEAVQTWLEKGIIAAMNHYSK
jgi:peptidyl-tRNA hydrolase, PTH1 family